jgi:hypothetical protein
LEQVGGSWKELKRRKKVLNHNPADWIGTSSRLHSKAKTPKLKIEGSSRLDGDPSDWINCPESGRNSRLQFLKNPVDWMVIQATRLINQNQAESP